MKTVTLILPLKKMTVTNPGDNSGVTIGAIEGLSVGVLIYLYRAIDLATISQC